jgi:hypothetical protein
MKEREREKGREREIELEVLVCHQTKRIPREFFFFFCKYLSEGFFFLFFVLSFSH